MKIDTREHIVETAFKLFFERGYREVTMNELVTATELSKGAFYHYFPSKAELYHHTVDKYFLRYLEAFSIELDKNLSIRENLKVLFQQYSQISEELKTIFNDGMGISNYLLFLREALRHEHFKKKIAVYYRMYTNTLADWFREAQNRSEIKNSLDPETLAKHITYLMEGQGLLFSLGFETDSMELTFNKIIDQFFDHIEIHDFSTTKQGKLK